MGGSRNATLLAAAAAVALAACGGGGSDEGTPPPLPPPVGLTTGEAAAVVIGQADFTGGEPNRGGDAAAANTLHTPAGSPAVVDGRLYLPDRGNNRVLGYHAIPTADGAAADFVLGQPSTTASAPGTSASALYAPWGIASSGGKLVVVDADNARVLVWNQVPAASGVAADVVVGKPDMVTGLAGAGCDASTTDAIEGAWAVAGKLIVADTFNHRVLVWNSIPTSNGRAADLVLGQADFTTCTANAGGVGASSLSSPVGVWSDGTRLLVVDSDNERVLVWTSFPTSNGEPADLVLGQPDLTSEGSAVSAARLHWPLAVSSNGTQIAVADCTGNRVLVWNAFPAASGASADVVLGQADFTSNGYGLSATRMGCPSGVLLHEDLLVVAEWDNSRVLVFR